MRSEILEQIRGIAYGFGNVAEPYPQTLEPWRKHAPHWKQTHGTRHASVDLPRAECGECDALSTTRVEIPIVVATADCVPVILVRRDTQNIAQEIAAIHAGWRGTLARIVEKTSRDLLERRTSEPLQSWCAIIGPSIGPCCFEVGDEVYEPFVDAFGESTGRGLATKPKHLDLWSANEAQLRGAGIATIERLDVCTRCASMPDGSPRYHSYRREKGERGGTRQWSGALLLR